AEDGIRDLIVTGVQTCALPIWAAVACRHLGPGRPGADDRRRAVDRALRPGAASSLRHGPRDPLDRAVERPGGGTGEPRLGLARRSEERRVGKEGRSGWRRENQE